MRTKGISARSAELAVTALIIVSAFGCAARGPGEGDEDESVASSEASLARGGGGTSAGYSCSGGTCTCDKSIENDCENMSGVCTDASIDALIACINGWLTTGCTCPQALVAPPPKTPIFRAPVGSRLARTF